VQSITAKCRRRHRLLHHSFGRSGLVALAAPHPVAPSQNLLYDSVSKLVLYSQASTHSLCLRLPNSLPQNQLVTHNTAAASSCLLPHYVHHTKSIKLPCATPNSPSDSKLFNKYTPGNSPLCPSSGGSAHSTSLRSAALVRLSYT
jgi:hypothetical protein